MAVRVFLFVRIVLVEAVRRRKSSWQSFIKLSYSSEVMRLISLKKFNQISVSAHSFRAIFCLYKNSCRLTEFLALHRFAPMDMPERNICLASTNSCFSSHKYLYNSYIFNANFRLFSTDVLISIYKIITPIEKNKEKILNLRSYHAAPDLRVTRELLIMIFARDDFDNILFDRIY